MSTGPLGSRRPGQSGPPTYARSAGTDGMLAEWGARTLWPSNPPGRATSGDPLQPLAIAAARQNQANAVRATVRRIVTGRGKQVMVKITPGKGNGMKAIGAHLRYISRLGQGERRGTDKTLDLEDERGDIHRTADDLKVLRQRWQLEGAYIPEQTKRREAFNIIFSMPVGTPEFALQHAVRQTARQLFAGHKYVMVLHTDQGAPHVHVMVRAEGADRQRLNPRKADLERWRATFAANLQDLGVDAINTRQATRLQSRQPHRQWEPKATRRTFQRDDPARQRNTPAAIAARSAAVQDWGNLAHDLVRSPDPKDAQLAVEVVHYLTASLQANPIPPAQGRQPGTATLPPKTRQDLTHARPDLTAQLEFYGRVADLQKSHPGQLAQRPVAQPLARLRKLSDVDVVHHPPRTEVFLQSHERHRLGLGLDRGPERGRDLDLRR